MRAWLLALLAACNPECSPHEAAQAKSGGMCWVSESGKGAACLVNASKGDHDLRLKVQLCDVEGVFTFKATYCRTIGRLQ